MKVSALYRPAIVSARAGEDLAVDDGLVRVTGTVDQRRRGEDLSEAIHRIGGVGGVDMGLRYDWTPVGRSSVNVTGQTGDR